MFGGGGGGGGGGSRTIHAYSFYVTYCKHTNARTAKPAVCPPPMYKIMYKKFEGRVRRRPLNAGLRSSPSRISSRRQRFVRQVHATRVGPRGMRLYSTASKSRCGLGYIVFQQAVRPLGARVQRESYASIKGVNLSRYSSANNHCSTVASFAYRSLPTHRLACS